MREVWEAAEALAKLGLTVEITDKGNLRVFRDGVKVGVLRFPLTRAS